MLENSEKRPGSGADSIHFIARVTTPPIKRPDRSRPCRIPFRTTDDVNMHLTDLIPDTGHVEFPRTEKFADEFRNPPHCLHHLGVSCRIQLVQVLNILHFRDQDEPRKNRVILEKQPTAPQPPNLRTACRKPRVKFE